MKSAVTSCLSVCCIWHSVSLNKQLCLHVFGCTDDFLHCKPLWCDGYVLVIWLFARTNDTDFWLVMHGVTQLVVQLQLLHHSHLSDQECRWSQSHFDAALPIGDHIVHLSVSSERVIIIIITKTMFMVLSSWQSHCESSPGSFDECRMAPSGCRPKTEPDDLGCESTCRGCQKLHPPSPFIIITQPKSWYSFYRPTEGRRLNRPSWLVTYRDGLPVHRRSPILVLTGSDVAQLRWSRPTRYH